MSGWLALSLNLAVWLYILHRGSRDQIIAAITLLSATLLTAIFYLEGPSNWLVIQWPIVAVDTTTLLIFLVVALRSKRFWPLPIAALQFLPVLTPLVASMGKNIVSDALGLTQALPSYLQLAILAIAARRHQERMATVSTK